MLRLYHIPQKIKAGWKLNCNVFIFYTHNTAPSFFSQCSISSDANNRHKLHTTASWPMGVSLHWFLHTCLQHIILEYFHLFLPSVSYRYLSRFDLSEIRGKTSSLMCYQYFSELICLLIWTTWSFISTGSVQGSTSCAFICEVRHTAIWDAFSFNIIYMGKLYAIYLALLFIQCCLWQYCLLSTDSLKNP